ncbi:FYVE-domain-containing protein [Gymnopus androsaceus JB14]|uniref:FYVE-domain-containing protein n=1 Tax=Gymnopus androsaceus JB14 TaxID=1447944 RepID=A0A6A4GV68_9AGAR|nr:FYVE-domain-containing protein [Gymnopus androsaceus JB14]
MRPREREFLLFSDCLVWLASEEAERKEKEWNFDLGSIWTSFSGGGGSGTSTPVQSESGERPKSAALAKSTPLIVEERVDNGSDENVVSASAVPRDLKRPPMARTRSKSEAEVTLMQAKAAVASTSNDVLDSPNILAKSKSALPTDKNARRPVHKSNFSRINKSSALHLHFRDRRGRKDSSSRPYGGWEKEQWLFKGKIDLVNLEIVIDTSVGIEEEGEEGDGELEWRWEVLSPQGSFVLYAVSAQDRADWTTLIRQAKSQQLVALNAQHPNSTLTSSEATQHVRRTLQALPFAPNDVRMQEVGLDKVLSRLSTGSGNGASVEEHHEGKGKGRDTKSHKKSSSKDKKASNPVWHKERRSRVEHWVPAIWIPDEKAEGCMRCGKTFGWRRRRHHCRLCGRCVCSSCSEKTFYIADPSTKDDAASKPARACNACYESVFPLIDPHPDPGDPTDAGDSTIRARPHPPPLPHSSFSDPTSSSFLPQSTSAMSYVSNADTITSLSHLPSWMNMSVPALALSSTSSATGVDARREKYGQEYLWASGPNGHRQQAI